MNFIFKAILLSLSCFIIKSSVAQYTGPIPPSFVGCVGAAFQSEGFPTILQTVNLATGTTTSIKSYSFSFNAMAFSRTDNRLYAIQNNTNGTAQNNLVVIGRDYSSVIVPLTGVSLAGLQINSGSASSDGYLYVEDGSKILRIDIDPSRSTFATVYNTAITVLNNYNDWAFNWQSNQYLYFVSGGNVYRKDITVNSAPVQIFTTGVNLPRNTQYGAIYMDRNNNMYAKDNNSGKTYKITNINSDPTNASLHVVSIFSDNVRVSVNNDAAACSLMATPINGDFGDAPDAYSTLGASDGPRHIMTGSTPLLSLGAPANMTAEVDGAPSDAANTDADNGVTVSAISNSGQSSQTIASYSTTVNVVNNTSSTAYLYGWIDWNNNGGFDDFERVGSTIPANTTQNIILTWTNATLSGPVGDLGTYARFRISTDNVSATRKIGQAPDGEVEDYYIPYSIVLPVSFGEIKAKILNGQLVVNWNTITERNNDHFEIEVSKDGKNFSIIGEAKSKFFSGNVDNGSYEFGIDMSDSKMQFGFAIFALSLLGGLASRRNRKWFATASVASLILIGFGCSKTQEKIDLPGETKVYVRIAQVDFDGKKSYSKTVTAYKAD